MEEINLESWEKFEERRITLREEHNEISSEFLYRGQSNKGWNLSTTLERNGKEGFSIKEYHHLISVVKPQIESFTGVDRNILSRNGFDEWLVKNSSIMPHAFGTSQDFTDTYSYMVYLRHYGFPSPLLDWSSSPYIAAYFAFAQASSDMDFVSMYVYLGSTSKKGLKAGDRNEAGIYQFGPYVRTDKRHFIQQCGYTACIIYDSGKSAWRYESHEKAFARGDTNQDVLWKFNIPYSERVKVLKMLDGYNINALSLFGSEERTLSLPFVEVGRTPVAIY